MYSSLQNQLFNMAHLILAFYILFIFYPKIVLKRSYETKLEDAISNYILMVFLLIIVGYLLVIVKLYEFLGIFLVLLGIFLYSHHLRNSGTKVEKTSLKFTKLIFDYMDNIKSIKEDIKNLTKVGFSVFFKNVFTYLKDKVGVFNGVIFIITILYSSYLRLYDAYLNAAPAMSDSYVTLKWMKFINNRMLFPDGIYPQGYHIYLATLQKFAFIDPLYILRYIGPINTVFITLGIYFVLSRITKDKATGVVGAIIYGILVSFLYSDAQRQAATNSQEFGYLFVIPTLYFFGRYIQTNKKRDLITALAGISITALVHTISFAFIAIGVAALLLIALLINIKKYWKRIGKVIGIGFISGFLGIIPLGIGILLKLELNPSSQEFLVSKVSVKGYHLLSQIDKIGLGCILLCFIYLLFNFRKLEEKFLYVFFMILGIVSFLIYYMGGYITQNSMVETRFTDFWSLTLPIIIGMAFYAVISILRNRNIRKVFALVAAIGFLSFSIFYIKSKPIIPYKMEYNSNVEQYLRISKMFIPTNWMIVSQGEGYAVVLGKGYHLMLGDFLNIYKPESKYLINEKGEILVTPDIFLYQEKNVFTTQFKNKDHDYPLRKIQDQMLQTWVDKYKETHTNLSIFYEDKNIRIFRIHQELSQKEKQNKIWGI